MIIDAYPCLAVVLIFGLVIAFGGDYEHNRRNQLSYACLETVGSQNCFLPSLGHWPAALP